MEATQFLPKLELQNVILNFFLVSHFIFLPFSKFCSFFYSYANIKTARFCVSERTNSSCSRNEECNPHSVYFLNSLYLKQNTRTCENRFVGKYLSVVVRSLRQKDLISFLFKTLTIFVTFKMWNLCVSVLNCSTFWRR